MTTPDPDEATVIPKVTEGDIRKWTKTLPLFALIFGGASATGVTKSVDWFGTRNAQAQIVHLDEQVDRLNERLDRCDAGRKWLLERNERLIARLGINPE